MRVLLFICVLILTACSNADTPTLARFETLTIDIVGPQADESPETFRDHRLTLTFTHEDGAQLNVPGFFAADGEAHISSAASGNIWRARFTPHMSGTWEWEANLRTGENIALNLDPAAGTALPLETPTGRFTVRDNIMPGGGTLIHAGGHYLRDAATNVPFLKTGAGSPENLLAFSDFDGTRDAGGTPFPALGEDQLHAFEPHMRDARAKDPVWGEGRGTALLGLINYLGDVGVNAQYMVTMNVEGDGQDVWPWVAPDRMDVFDVSKLAQWNIVFEHMNANGVMTDFILTETENESLFEALDGNEIGVDFADSRKLYYREMIARFGHLRRLTWNLGEENGVAGNSGQDPYRQPTSPAQRQAFTAYIRALVHQDHPIVSHNWPDSEIETYGELLGHPDFSGISLQAHHSYAEKIVEWRQRSSETGKPWLIFVDEPLGWEYGARPDSEDPTQDRARREVLWPALFAGGSGIDWYFGWQNNAPTSDLSNEDMRSRNTLWRQSTIAREFFETHLPFTDMQSIPSEYGNTPIFAKPGEVYALYLPDGGSADIRLPEGSWRTFWFNPRAGGPLIEGSLIKLIKPGLTSTGRPPSEPDQDWISLIRRADPS
jgi:hypothetical protein